MRSGRVVTAMLSIALVNGFGVAPVAGQAPDGQALYREHCRTCHGAIGAPPQRALAQYPRIPVISDSAFLAARSEDSVVVVLQRGVGRDMKSFKDKLTLAEMRAVAAYMWTLQRRRAP